LMATALRYNSEVRDEKQYFDDIPDIKIPSDMLDLAVHILQSKKTKFNPDKFEDRYENALVALIKAKQAGKPAPKLAEPKPSNVINLMDALRRSVKAEQSGAKPQAPSRRKRAPQRRGGARKRASTTRTRARKAS